MKHTPGPWFNCRYSRSIKVTSQSSAFDRGCFNIAKYPMRTDKSLVSHEEWEANGDLIAAAPEMLDILERWLKFYNYESMDKNDLAMESEMIAIVKKAKGG